jgi:hypothetical protein
MWQKGIVISTIISDGRDDGVPNKAIDEVKEICTSFHESF